MNLFLSTELASHGATRRGRSGPHSQAQSQTPVAQPESRPRARSNLAVAHRESMLRTDASSQSHDPSRPGAARQHPRSWRPRRKQPPLRGPPRVQIRTDLGYTLSASGVSSNRLKVVVAQPLSVILGPDALRLGEISRLRPTSHVHLTAH